MKLYLNKVAILFVIAFSSLTSAALPSNISDLVESSAPAVVNITSRKEVKMQNSLGVLMNLKDSLASPEEEVSLNLNNLKQEKRLLMAPDSFLKVDTC